MGNQNTRSFQIDQEKPKTGDISSLAYIANKVALLFSKKGYSLSFKGLSETYKNYSEMRVENLFGLWELIFEIDAWQEYLEEIQNISQSIKEGIKCEVDYLDSLTKETLVRYSEIIKNKKQEVAMLEQFEKELEKHIHKLSESSNYCKNLFSKQIGNYRK